MRKFVKWRDKSFQTSRQPETWVPAAKIHLIEGGTVYPREVTLSSEDSERIKRGEIIYSSHAQAKSAAYEMVKRCVWTTWAIAEQDIQEYTSSND
jgi:hypothetical protein